MARSTKANRRRAKRTKASPSSSARPVDEVALRTKLKSCLDGSNHAELITLVDELVSERDAAVAERDAVAAECSKLEAARERLQRQVHHLARMLFGRRSERLKKADLAQLTLAFGGSEQQAQGAQPDVPTPQAPTECRQDGSQAQGTERNKPDKRNHPGRTKLSPELERKVTKVTVPEDERDCQCCGRPMETFDYQKHERVEYVPAKLIVHEEHREKLACKACNGDAVTAERKSTPAVARRAGASLLAELLESKCDDALPVHRQRDKLRRLGFDVPSNTLYGYWNYSTELLMPVAQTTHSVVLGDPIYVALDDTTLRVLDRTKKRGIYRGHLWCFAGGSSPLVAYDFTTSWEAEEIVPWIAAIDDGTFIQCDDYKGYSKHVNWPGGGRRILVPDERRLGCSMHVRRRFVTAFDAGDKRATEPISMWKRLYEIEAYAKDNQLTASERAELRAERSIPILDRFDAWVDDHKRKVLPTSALARAVGYAEHQRPFIRRCFSDGRFEIDNGHVERQIREPALGRKNFLFTGSEQAAKRLAGAYTLVQSCRNVGISTRDYLIDVIDKLERGWPMRRIRELVPDQWATLHAGSAKQ